MKIRKGAVFLIQTPDGIQSSIVNRTHSLKGFVIIGGTGESNGRLLVLQKDRHFDTKKPIYMYVNPSDITDI